jgi:hypothetical protein
VSVSTPTARTDYAGLPIRPGGPVIDDTWSQVAGNVHHAYARGALRIGLYSGEDAITSTSGTYEQPDPVDALSAVWRPLRVATGSTYRLRLHVYGKDLDVRITAYDARVSGGGSLGTAEASCGASAEWADVLLSLDAADVLDSGDPIPIALTLEIKTSSEGAGLYHAHVAADVLTTATLP